MRRTLYAAVCSLTGLMLAMPSSAQNTSLWTFKIGAGFTEPVVHTNNRLNMGFNIGGGAGINLTPRLGLTAEFNYNDLGLTTAALRAAGMPDGSTRIYSVTAQPVFRFNPRGKFDVYATGGGGFYRRTVEFTQPSVGQATAFDPFYGVFYPVAVPTSLILSSYTQNKGGLNVGAGVSVRLFGDSNTKFFAEARYHYIFTTPVATTVLPVTFGFRW